MGEIVDNFKIRFERLLKKTEQYTKTDMIYLVRGGFWSLFSQVVGIVSSFCVVVFLANILPKESLGQYRFILSLIPILLIFTLPGIDTSLVRSVARKSIVDLKRISKIKIRWGFISSFSAIILAAYYFFNDDLELAYAFILSALFLPFIETYSIYSSYYKGKQDFKTSSIYDSISRVLQASFIIIVVLINENLLSLLAAYLIGQLITRFYFYKKTLSNIRSEVVAIDVDKEIHDDTVEYGKHLSATQVIGTITSNIDKLLIWHFLGAEILAIYYVSLTIPKNVVLLCNVIPRISLPKFSQNAWKPEDHSKILRKLAIFSSVLVVPALIYCLLAPLVIPLIFKDYYTSIPTIIILSLFIILSPSNTIIGQILQAKKYLKKIIFLQVLALITFVVCLFIMYEIWGIGVTGAVGALVIKEAIVLLAGFFLIR